MNQKKIVSIYALINPINKNVFYIGATTKPKPRLTCHVSSSKGMGGTKNYEIIRIVNSGQKVEMLILDTCASDQAGFFERFYIDLFSSYGFTLLQNKKSSYSDAPRLKPDEKLANGIMEIRKVISEPFIKEAMINICSTYGLSPTEYMYGLVIEDVKGRICNENSSPAK